MKLEVKRSLKPYRITSTALINPFLNSASRTQLHAVFFIINFKCIFEIINFKYHLIFFISDRHSLIALFILVTGTHG